eukprot:TRINITY_DN13466_c1_g1_i1.p2 TRINITY_DN13466_c1_g1~~TRINITY_DN13466_c1_g1_i1.p2  ORF type:complete len:344 (+),score=114.05 TRINITY_DN13466_c1_g1_i1:36-1034(+)
MFKKFAAAVEQTTTRGSALLNSAMGVEATVDEEFEIQRKQFASYVSTVDSMSNHLKNQGAGLTTLAESLRKFGGYAATFNGEDHGIIAALPAFQNSVEGFNATVEQHLAVVKQFEVNLKYLSGNLTGLNKEINERDRLILDYDKARHDYNTETKKPTASPQLPILQQRMEQTKALYEQRNAETYHHLSESYRTRTIHDDYKAMVSSYARLFATGANLFQQASQQVNAAPTYVAPTGKPYVAPTIATGTFASPKTQAQAHTQPASRAPPPVPSKVSAQPQARALYAFQAQGPSELSLNPGDIVTINNDSHPEWWIGSLNGRSGEFPSNYVQKL